MPTIAAQRPQNRAGFSRIVGLMLFGVLTVALTLQTILGDYELAGTLMSRSLWVAVCGWLGASVLPLSGSPDVVDVPFLTLSIVLSILACASWLLGGMTLSWKYKSPARPLLATWGWLGFRWWLLPGVWWLLWTVAAIAGWDAMFSFLASTPQLWLSLALAGFAATFFSLAADRDDMLQRPSDRQVPKSVWIAVALYALIFTMMNWQLYFGLLLPHGDSAMYEEHLWNLEHGKGFRSYLDSGLFLGEHIQVIHVALVPFHLLWPSQLLLELCESLALASGAIPIFWMARRHTGSVRAATLLAFAYLLYFPMQFLDIAIDLKTFRPIAFGVPLLLFALDQMERRRYVSMALLLVATLTAKEDYSLVIAPLGVWLLCRGIDGSAGTGSTQQPADADRSPRSQYVRSVGALMALLSAGYLLLVLLVLIPVFRSGHDPHYTGYFGWLHEAARQVEDGGWRVEDGGVGPVELARVIVTRPAIWLGRLFSTKSLFSALTMLVPAAFLPLLSPGRLAVAAPLFVLLCLMDVSGGSPQAAGLPLIPFHHFHAPLIAIIFWAAAAGLSNAPGLCGRIKERLSHTSQDSKELDNNKPTAEWVRHFAWTSALTGGFFLSLGPLSVPFWDSGSQWHWKRLYVPGERAREFPAVLAMIPSTARVASTDLIHPRFTHHARSYDYSAFPRAVNNNQPGAPPDSDYIVIDKQGRYNNIKQLDQIVEYRERPQEWDVLLNSDYFIVLKRKSNPSP